MAISARLEADWLKAPELAAVWGALGPEDCRLVGGCVRDGLLGVTVSDIDLATRHRPDVVMKKAQAAGLKTVPTGLSHGTVTVIANSKPFEITTLREDVETDGRHAVVQFASDWKTDAARRDFTINALYATHDGAVEDYFGGLDDLKEGRVRFIGVPHERIDEDALRILRFYRFSVRFASILDGPARIACRALKAMVAGLSQERIAAEWLKILAHPAPLDGLRAMAGDGVLAQFLPEANVEALEAVLAAEQAYGLDIAVPRRFAALLPWDASIAEAVGSRLKLSNAIKTALIARSTAMALDSPIESLFYSYGPDLVLDMHVLQGQPIAASLMTQATAWVRPQFPVSGHDVAAATGLSGKPLGDALKRLEADWVDSGFQMDKAALLASLSNPDMR